MHEKKVINNCFIGLIFQITMMLIGFVTRKVFIVFLSEELLGLNSLYTNLLDLLNLADLGIGVAIQYQLYEPLVNKDFDKLSKIITAATKIYKKIGLIILLTGLVISMFIPLLIKENNYPAYFVRITFLISVLGLSFSYLFQPKRIFFQADEEFGIVNLTDLIVKAVTSIIALWMTARLKNYYIYLFVCLIYSVVSSIIIHHIFIKKYPTVSLKANNYLTERRKLTENIKNVLPIKLSNYVYNSTDSIIISKVLGLISVARYSNYMTIINGLMGIEFISGAVVASSFGKKIKLEKNKSKVYEAFLQYQFLHSLIICFCTVSLWLLMDPFLRLWLGDQYIINDMVLILLVIDFYIHSMYQPVYVLYGSAGKFGDDKLITIVSAVMNLVISLIAVMFWGLFGVIIGTLITDIYIWIIRTYQIVRGYFEQSMFKYSLLMIKYIIVTATSVIVSYFVAIQFSVDNALLELIIRSGICILIPNLLFIMINLKSEEMKTLKKTVFSKKR